MNEITNVTQQTQLEILEKRFNQIKNEQNKIKGTSVLSTLKPYFKGMPDTDFEAVFSTYVAQLSLNDADKTIAIEQLKYVYLGIYDQMKKIKTIPFFGIFDFQSHYTLRRSHITLTSLPSMSKQPIFKIFYKQLTQIIPYQIIFFDSLYKREERQKSNKTPQKLTEQTQEESYYCYDFKIYEALLENFEGPLMNKLVRFFYEVIDFRWIQALDLLKNQLVNDPNIRQSPYLIPVFQNLKTIQEQVQKNPNVMKPIFEKRKTLQYPNLNNFSPPQIAKTINQNKNILDFVCNYCANIYQQIQDPYLRATCYFLGKKFEPNSTFQQICNNDNLGVMIKFLFARRFLAPSNFAKYYSNFIIETKINPKLQHIMFLKNKYQVVQTLSSYWDENPNDLQKVALTCGVVIHKLGKGFNKQYPFLEQMIKTYEELLRAMEQKEMHKQYMMKMMKVRSSKQPLWEDLIVKPQFRLNCQPRNDDCVFLSMLEKFIYGGDQKWNKLKTKSSVAADPSKKHYQVQAKYCPYCNFPTPRCSICLEHIKIFTVKSYLNQQIKRKTEKEQKPYMKLSQPLEEALIWCPSCAHGGHFGHLQSWFKQNKTCPVDKCPCKCKY